MQFRTLSDCYGSALAKRDVKEMRDARSRECDKRMDVRGANTRLLFRHIGKIQIRHWVPTCSRVVLKGCLGEIGLRLSGEGE